MNNEEINHNFIKTYFYTKGILIEAILSDMLSESMKSLRIRDLEGFLRVLFACDHITFAFYDKEMDSLGKL